MQKTMKINGNNNIIGNNNTVVFSSNSNDEKVRTKDFKLLLKENDKLKVINLITKGKIGYHARVMY